jgi:hypothetical protein
MFWGADYLEPQGQVRFLVAPVPPLLVLKALTSFALPPRARLALPQGSWQVGLRVM